MRSALCSLRSAPCFIIPNSHRGVGAGPYGFRLGEPAYSSERPEAAFPLPNSNFCPPLSVIRHPLSESLYETTQVDVFIWLKSTVSLAGSGLNSEPQNIEYRTAESSKGGQVSKDGFARAAQALASRVAQSFINRQNTLNLQSSIFNSGLSGLDLGKNAFRRSAEIPPVVTADPKICWMALGALLRNSGT